MIEKLKELKKEVKERKKQEAETPETFDKNNLKKIYFYPLQNSKKKAQK